jgi:hypothetical protein
VCPRAGQITTSECSPPSTTEFTAHSRGGDGSFTTRLPISLAVGGAATARGSAITVRVARTLMACVEPARNLAPFCSISNCVSTMRPQESMVLGSRCREYHDLALNDLVGCQSARLVREHRPWTPDHREDSDTHRAGPSWDESKEGYRDQVPPARGLRSCLEALFLTCRQDRHMLFQLHLSISASTINDLAPNASSLIYASAIGSSLCARS